MMTTKDWILLLLPIIFNSLIFYFIQKRFENKMRKRNEYEDKKRDLERSLYQSCNKLIRLMNSLDEEARKNIVEFNMQQFYDNLLLFNEELKNVTKIIDSNIEMEEYTKDANNFITNFNGIYRLTIQQIRKYHSLEKIEDYSEYFIEEEKFQKSVQISIRLVIAKIGDIKNKIRESIKN